MIRVRRPYHFNRVVANLILEIADVGVEPTIYSALNCRDIPFHSSAMGPAI